jgi:type I restriction enzyme R subunit
MDTPSFKEDHISLIPALQLLQKLGYQYLTPEEALQLRGNKTTNVLLEDVLRFNISIGKISKIMYSMLPMNTV